MTAFQVTEEMMSAGARAMDGWSGPHHARRDLARKIYLAMKSAAPQHTGLVIDLEKNAMQSLIGAAGQSNWIPPDYYMNDWISDCCEFLRTGKGISDTGLTDVGRLVIAARNVAYGGLFDGCDEEQRAAIRELDRASEAFASSIPWESEPNERS